MLNDPTIAVLGTGISETDMQPYINKGLHIAFSFTLKEQIGNWNALFLEDKIYTTCY